MFMKQGENIFKSNYKGRLNLAVYNIAQHKYFEGFRALIEGFKII